MTIPNLLTLARIFLTPVLVWFLLDGKLTPALIVFFIAGVTDALDGLIARVFNQQSRFGAYIDPLADKILLVTSFVILGYIGLVPKWLVIIAVSRDFMILIGLFTLMFHQVKVEIKPFASSKLTTLFQLITIFTMLGSALLPLPSWAYMLLFFVTAGFCVFSGASYLYAGLGLLGQHRTRNAGE
jgi:cardiolipin synthase